MRIGILIPTIKGREELCRRATYSVRWQTWNGPISPIVIDNTGRSPAEGFERCLREAVNCQYVMPLADDDWLAPHAVQTLADLLRDGADFASGRTLITGNGSDQIIGEPLSEQRFIDQGFVFGGAHMWDKRLTDHIGGFNPEYPNAADYDLYWRIAASKPHVAFTNEILYFHTDHPAKDGHVNGAAAAEQCARIREANLR